MKIIFWSDYACPYCYIGEERLKKAIASLGLEGAIDLEPKAFELDPTFPKTPQSDTATRFAAKYRMPLAQAQATIEGISEQGRAEGIDFRYATTRYTNTFDAHRLMKLALHKNDRSVAEKVNTLLFDAYFTLNLVLADHDTLVAVGTKAGLMEEEIRKMLSSNQFAEEVRADEKEAAQRGVHGVPYFLLENGQTIPGAISVEDFRRVIQGIYPGGVGGGKARQCGPNGCEI